MATHLTQTIDLEGLPAWMRTATARYKGRSPALANWLGHDLKMSEVEACIPPGERSVVAIQDADGNDVYPWRDVPVVEVDELGAVVAHSW